MLAAATGKAAASRQRRRSVAMARSRLGPPPAPSPSSLSVRYWSMARLEAQLGADGEPVTAHVERVVGGIAELVLVAEREQPVLGVVVVEADPGAVRAVAPVRAREVRLDHLDVEAQHRAVPEVVVEPAVESGLDPSAGVGRERVHDRAAHRPVDSDALRRQPLHLAFEKQAVDALLARLVEVAQSVAAEQAPAQE